MKNFFFNIYLVLNLFIFFSGCFSSTQVNGNNRVERMTTEQDVTNIYSRPDFNSKVLWQVEKYHPLIVIKKEKKWCKIIDFQGDTAWVHKTFLTKTEGVITIKLKSNVRLTPHEKGFIIFTVEKDVPFKVLEKEGNWIKIEHADGDFGWIDKNHVW